MGSPSRPCLRTCRSSWAPSARGCSIKAINLVGLQYPELELGIHELAPQESIELLYGRRLNIALLATNSIATTSLSFHQVDVVSDPYVLVTPAGIDLTKVHDVDADLPAAERRLVNRCIQFNFGTQHGG